MDRETRVYAENHFRGLQGRPPGGACPPPGCVDFIENPDSFSYADFFKGYLLPNMPCVFSSSFTAGWGSRRHWVTSSGKPNFEHLLRKYGDVVVPVANCGVQEYNSNPKEHMPLRDYISYWQEYIQGGYFSPRGCLYLKDWHLCRDSSAEDVFTLPVYFSSDWLNEYWDSLDVDDYRFVYMGPTGTWSPFHADIFRSFSWSVNICGRKKWFFFPPGQEEALRDCHGGLPYDVTSPALLDRRLYPTREHCSPPLEVTQEAGEMVFVPSGWHHQVHNLVGWAHRIPHACSMAQTGQGDTSWGPPGVAPAPESPSPPVTAPWPAHQSSPLARSQMPLHKEGLGPPLLTPPCLGEPACRPGSTSPLSLLAPLGHKSSPSRSGEGWKDLQAGGGVVPALGSWGHLCLTPPRRTPSPSTTTGSMAVTWPTCGTSCSKSSVPCSRRSVSGGTPCLTGTIIARSS
ncbi:2-oxoglutarate and iron-dependent oxygenase JMJD4 isoform X1 [Leopardus geoffroyi]|uniref:2-oxoglutarate and iron-dependent oxygenase JMJD4 isoform X1 n=1 Tax=Leopardus geoffroyi TaxID=46844 RepID=UPI001E265908|nr:2-oxoglutarate and iron-dependent oxygenase JMJD4 isoform X1 [Leopardus geoffroyi]